MSSQVLATALKGLADDDLPEQWDSVMLRRAILRATGKDYAQNSMSKFVQALKKAGYTEIASYGNRTKQEPDLWREKRTVSK